MLALLHEALALTVSLLSIYGAIVTSAFWLFCACFAHAIPLVPLEWRVAATLMATLHTLGRLSGPMVILALAISHAPSTFTAAVAAVVLAVLVVGGDALLKFSSVDVERNATARRLFGITYDSLLRDSAPRSSDAERLRVADNVFASLSADEQRKWGQQAATLGKVARMAALKLVCTCLLATRVCVLTCCVRCCATCWRRCWWRAWQAVPTRPLRSWP